MISGSTWYKRDSTLNDDEKEEYDKVGLKDWYLNYHIRDRLVYYSTLYEDEKEEYELWFNHIKESRINGLVFK